MGYNGFYIKYIFLLLATPAQCANAINANYMRKGKACILLNDRSSARFESEAAANAYVAANPVPEYQETKVGWNTRRCFAAGCRHKPKNIGQEGQCFSKCRDIPFFMENDHLAPKSTLFFRRAPKWHYGRPQMEKRTKESEQKRAQKLMQHRSCVWAKALGCKATSSGELAFIDKKTGTWRLCHCASKRFSSTGFCMGGWTAR